MDRQREEVAAAAAFWDARLRAPTCTDEDRKAFTQWRDSAPAHREAFERLQSVVAKLRQERSRADLRAMRDAALAVCGRQTRARWSLAAGLAGLALAVLWTLSSQPAWLNWGGAETFSTGIGQRSTVALPDGSTVELNSKTRIQVAFDAQRRLVKLLEGQAIFQVAKNAQRPFVVRAGDREIVAIGTAFDVRLDLSSLRVTLLEGKVAVAPEGGARPQPRTTQPRSTRTSSADGARSDTFHLRPGQQLVIARSLDLASPALIRKPEIREIDVTKVTSWRAGRVFLSDMTLPQAVSEMNRYSTVQIVLADASLEQLQVNGMFRAGDNPAFARALEAYFPIIAERRSENEIVLKARH